MTAYQTTDLSRIYPYGVRTQHGRYRPVDELVTMLCEEIARTSILSVAIDARICRETARSVSQGQPMSGDTLRSLAAWAVRMKARRNGSS